MLKKLSDLIVPISGIISFIILIIQLINLIIGHIKTNGIILLIILLLIVLYCLLYIIKAKQHSSLMKGRKLPKYNIKVRRIAKVFLVIYTFIIIISSIWLIYNKYSSPKNYIVLVTKINGPDPDKYRLTDIIINELKNKTKGLRDVRIKGVDIEVTENLGLEYACKIGKEYKASIVIWGWYGVTASNGILTIRFEDLHELNYTFPELIKHSDFTFTLDSKLLTNIINEKYFTFEISQLNNFNVQNEIANTIFSITNTIMGVMYFHFNDFDKAINLFNNSYNTHQTNLIPNYKQLSLQYIALTYAAKGDYKSAIKNYNILINSTQTEPIFYLNRGIIYQLMKDHKNAVQDFDNVIKLYSNDPMVYNMRGISKSELSDYDNAEKDYYKSIKINANYSSAYANIGYVKFLKKDYDSAIYYLNKAIEISDNISNFYTSRGKAYKLCGNLPYALADLNKAINLDKTNRNAYLLRSEVWEQINDTKNALKDINKLIKLDPDHPGAYKERGDIMRNLEEYESALSDYNKALEINPMNYIVYLSRASLYMKLNQDSNAIHDLNFYVSKYPEYYMAYYNRGVFWKIHNNFDRAINDYDKYLEYKKDDNVFSQSDSVNLSVDMNNLGLYILKNSKNFNKAIAYFSEAILMNPNNSEAYANRSEAEGNIKEIKKAIADIDTAISIKPTESRYYFNRGTLKYKYNLDNLIRISDSAFTRKDLINILQNNNEAIEDYTRAIEIDSNNLYFFNRGVARMLIGDFKGSLNDHNESLSIDSTYGEAFYSRGILFQKMGNVKAACKDWKQAEKLGIQKAQQIRLKFCKD